MDSVGNPSYRVGNNYNQVILKIYYLQYILFFDNTGSIL